MVLYYDQMYRPMWRNRNIIGLFRGPCMCLVGCAQCDDLYMMHSLFPNAQQHRNESLRCEHM